MIKASIDIGSNSILLLVADLEKLENLKNVIKKEIYSSSYITSLGKDLDKNKKFLVETMEASFSALTEIKLKLREFNIYPKDVVVTATEASRVADNFEEFSFRIYNELGFEIIKISAKGEAFFTALGVASSIKTLEEKIIVMDMGGASTELIKIQLNPFKIIESISLPIGSVRAMDWKNTGVFDSKLKEILNIETTTYKTSEIVCVAGTMTSLASVFMKDKSFNEESINGLKISNKEFLDLVNYLENSTPKNLEIHFPYLKKRIPMLPAGAFVAKAIFNCLGVSDIVISTKGLRHGVLINGGVSNEFCC